MSWTIIVAFICYESLFYYLSFKQNRVFEEEDGEDFAFTSMVVIWIAMCAFLALDIYFYDLGRDIVRVLE